MERTGGSRKVQVKGQLPVHKQCKPDLEPITNHQHECLQLLRVLQVFPKL